MLPLVRPFLHQVSPAQSKNKLSLMTLHLTTTTAVKLLMF
jgi:hypothetical protein